MARASSRYPTSVLTGLYIKAGPTGYPTPACRDRAGLEGTGFYLAVPANGPVGESSGVVLRGVVPDCGPRPR